MRIPNALVKLAAEQAGVISRKQSLALGLAASTIDTLVRSGRWQRLHPGVYAITSGLICDLAAVHAALLAISGDAAASHRTSIWLARPKGPMPRLICIAVSSERRVVQPSGVCLHRLERLEAVGSPRRTRVERAVLDTIHGLARADQVVTAICEVVGDRLTTPTRILLELNKRPRQRWRRLVVDMLTDVAEGAQSGLELDDLRNDRNHGMPVGHRQVRTRSGGEGRWQDVLLQITPDGPVVAKELDGRLGHEGTGRFRDMARDNAGVVSGALPLRFGWINMARSPCDVAAMQSLLWERLGYPDVGHDCQRPRCNFRDRVRKMAKAHPLLVSLPRSA